MSALAKLTSADLQVATFYQFTALDSLSELRSCLQILGDQHGLRGTLLLADEGINATVSGSADGIAALREHLQNDPRFAALNWKQAAADDVPFQRWKVRIKREIVSFGLADLHPEQRTGIAVAPKDWDALIARDDIVLIDTRNDYEVAVGRFDGAIDPATRKFSDFPQFVEQQLRGRENQPIAMYCTGGIRCEKASAYLLQQGFGEVFQLHGGILNYLAEKPAAESRWQGECFVFDERVAVDHAQRGGRYVLCADCGIPLLLDAGTRCAACVDAVAKNS
ncbi:rhodanese-related sulfurtransferase [Pseudolysobacter antarcticus]|uniref:tRNA uridine(34) hydroxylase n=1 Tax=Pseudolysobacter antarcticus TaxID=2511995 RepID=A0A411HHV4_9GAMM|nr:rhodanese-related sulfurtransferase [Pseudolysobacter antarcticus]QBB70099.1 rhodanese-related sulfurtransferase [Pseudolysobacter antarcticus]